MRFSYAVPLVSFSFLGVETVAVTAFEAKYSKSLRLPSQIIAYVVFILYLLCAIGELLNIKWTDNFLPVIFGGVDNSTTIGEPQYPRSNSMAVIATWQAGFHNLAGFLNGCLIFSVLSCSNTALYVASRTLYGMTREIPRTNFLGRLLNGLSTVVPATGVPAPALIVSALTFFWLPFVQLNGGYAVQDVYSTQRPAQRHPANTPLVGRDLGNIRKR